MIKAEDLKIQEEEEIKRMEMQRLEEELYVDPNEDIEHPPLAISYGEHRVGSEMYPTPIATLGNIVFIQAPPKSTKTFFVSLLSSIYLGGNSDKYAGGLKGHRDGRCLFHFDTEQGKFHAQRVFKRTLRMTGLDNECYHTYGLRSLSAKQRVDFIEYCLYDKQNAENIGMCIIDGVADLVEDVNDISGSNEAIQRLMRWSQELNCTILTVIHTNIGTDKPTGHLGSALQKKCETSIQLEKVKDQNEVLVTCKQSRNFPFEDFAYKIDEVGLPTVIDSDAFLFRDTKIDNFK